MISPHPLLLSPFLCHLQQPLTKLMHLLPINFQCPPFLCPMLFSKTIFSFCIFLNATFPIYSGIPHLIFFLPLSQLFFLPLAVQIYEFLLFIIYFPSIEYTFHKHRKFYVQCVATSLAFSISLDVDLELNKYLLNEWMSTYMNARLLSQLWIHKNV